MSITSTTSNDALNLASSNSIYIEEPLIETFDDFIEIDKQKHELLNPELFKHELYNQISNENQTFLNNNEWPRVELLPSVDNLQHQENDVVNGELAIEELSGKLSKLLMKNVTIAAKTGIVSNAPHDLNELSNYVSNITSTLRISSKVENVTLIAENSIDSNADDDLHKPGVFLTQVTSITEDNKTKLKDWTTGLYNAELVETITYPGMDEAMPMLPNSVSPKNMMVMVLNRWNIQNKTRSKWMTFLTSKVSQRILRDVFWYIWHLTFKKNPEIQMQLLNRISKNYVDFLLNCENLLFKDEFFKAYPNVMAESTHHSFYCCFPKSIKHFGAEFKVKICDCYSKWMNGIESPFQPWSNEWTEYDVVSIMKQENNIAKDVESGKVIGDVVKKQEKKTVMISNRIGPGLKIKRCKFDIHGNSPAVENYLKRLHCSRAHAPFLMTRSDVVRDSEDEYLPTFKEILTESKKCAKEGIEEYKIKIDKVQKERANISLEMSKTLLKERRAAEYILARPQLMKEKADQVVLMIQEKEMKAKEREHKKQREILLSKTC